MLAAAGLPLQTLFCHKAQVSSAQFNLAGDKVVTGSYDKTAIIWDVETGKPEYYVDPNLTICEILKAFKKSQRSWCVIS